MKNDYAGVDTSELPTQTNWDAATGEMSMRPLTEWEALNVARNILHSIIFADGIGGPARVGEQEYHKAKPRNSDTRQAMLWLETIQARLT